MKKIMLFCFLILATKPLFAMDLLEIGIKILDIYLEYKRSKAFCLNPVRFKFIEQVKSNFAIGKTIKTLFNKKSLYKILGINAGLFIMNNGLPYYFFKQEQNRQLNNPRTLSPNAWEGIKARLKDEYTLKYNLLMVKCLTNEPLDSLFSDACDSLSKRALGLQPLVRDYDSHDTTLKARLKTQIERYNQEAEGIYGLYSTTFNTKGLTSKESLLIDYEYIINEKNSKTFYTLKRFFYQLIQNILLLEIKLVNRANENFKDHKILLFNDKSTYCYDDFDYLYSLMNSNIIMNTIARITLLLITASTIISSNVMRG